MRGGALDLPQQSTEHSHQNASNMKGHLKPPDRQKAMGDISEHVLIKVGKTFHVYSISQWQETQRHETMVLCLESMNASLYITKH